MIDDVLSHRDTSRRFTVTVTRDINTDGGKAEALSFHKPPQTSPVFIYALGSEVTTAHVFRKPS